MRAAKKDKRKKFVGLLVSLIVCSSILIMISNIAGPCSAQSPPQASTLVSPPDGTSGLTDTWVTLEWANSDPTITNYLIHVGTSSPQNTDTANADIFNANVGTLTSKQVTVPLGETIYWAVRADNNYGSTWSTESWSFSVGHTPDEPTFWYATPGDGFVYLVWWEPFDGGYDITNYKLYRGTSSGGETLYKTLSNVLNYNDTDVTNGETYYYQVSAVNSKGEGPRSAETSAKPVGKPSAPLSLTATPGDEEINLEWSPPSDDGGSAVTGYKIYSGISTSEISIKEEVSTTSYKDTHLTNGKIYYYKVSAVNGVGEGAKTSIVSATPSGLPGAPLNLEAIRGDEEIALTWEEPLDDGGAMITSYKIYCDDLFVYETSALQYTHTDLNNGEEYTYIVIAVNTNGEGKKSTPDSATPGTVPTMPQNVEVSTYPDLDGVISLSWQEPLDNGGFDIIEYNIYRGSSSGSLVQVDTTVGSQNEYSETGLVNGNEYYYQISAVNSLGEGELTNEILAIPYSYPSEPQDVRTLLSDGKVELMWSEPGDNGGSEITGYRIYRAEGSEDFELFDETEDTSYKDRDVEEGEEYFYKVSAVTDIGEGDNSSVVMVEVPVSSDDEDIDGSDGTTDGDSDGEAGGTDGEDTTGDSTDESDSEAGSKSDETNLGLIIGVIVGIILVVVVISVLVYLFVLRKQ